jgi:hypothetical protein
VAGNKCNSSGCRQSGVGPLAGWLGQDSRCRMVDEDGMAAVFERADCNGMTPKENRTSCRTKPQEPLRNE